MTSRTFDDSLLNAVDFTFNSLGKSSKQALYFHLKSTFHVQRREIPEKIEEFDDAIRQIFKDGAVYLEKLILEKLCDFLNVKFEKETADFAMAVFKVKNMVSEREPMQIVSDFNEDITAAKKVQEVKKA